MQHAVLVQRPLQLQANHHVDQPETGAIRLGSEVCLSSASSTPDGPRRARKPSLAGRPGCLDAGKGVATIELPKKQLHRGKLPSIQGQSPKTRCSQDMFVRSAARWAGGRKGRTVPGASSHTRDGCWGKETRASQSWTRWRRRWTQGFGGCQVALG